MTAVTALTMPNEESAADLLARLYPPLARYWPNLASVSAPQTAFLLLDHLEAFYGGSAGGGKSDALLAAALQYVDVPNYAALILRRSFRQLDQPDAIMARSKEWLMDHRQSGVRWNDDAKRWTFPSGATLTFGYLDHEDDVYNYQGPAFQFVGWDELTQFPEEPYKYLFSRTRRRTELRDLGIPIRHRSASNPGGIGHGWVKQRFIDSDTRERSSVFIPAKMRDNPGLDVDEYRLSMAHLDETLRKQLEDGDWDVAEGLAFRLTNAHLIDSFPMGDAHNRFEAADYGLNGAPWALVAIDYEGNLIFQDLIAHPTNDTRPYPNDLIPSELAPLVLAKRKAGWGFGHRTFIDPSIWHRTGRVNRWGRPALLADEFVENGIMVEKANNDPRAGLVRSREILKLDPDHRFPLWHDRRGEPGSPRVFFTPACAEIVRELRIAPLQPLNKADGGEKVDPEWESRNGHACAMFRYAVMTKPDASDEPVYNDPLAPPDPPAKLRAELLAKHKEQQSGRRRRRDYTV